MSSQGSIRSERDSGIGVSISDESATGTPVSDARQRFSSAFIEEEQLDKNMEFQKQGYIQERFIDIYIYNDWFLIIKINCKP